MPGRYRPYMTHHQLVQLAAMDASGWTAYGTWATAAVALAGAIYAGVQVHDARQLRRDQAKPFVVVDFEQTPGTLHGIDFVIHNTGLTLAKNVKVTFDTTPEAALQAGYPLKDSALLKNGIPSMPPGKRITALFDWSTERHKSELPVVYTATVDCEDSRGKKQDSLTYVLDLSIRYGLMSVQQPGISDAAKALIAVAETLESIEGHLEAASRGTKP